jgi:hypothetical protein
MTTRRGTAGKIDPEGAKVADTRKTDDCLHPLPSLLQNLHCTYCGVFILQGRVLGKPS